MQLTPRSACFTRLIVRLRGIDHRMNRMDMAK
jgi:hypothetical protein